ncbi:MAG: hypothetical protein GX585_04295 [Clostridiales bacterium]|nr:hypothetical protein [Clostridiales bacterium]
MSRLLRDFFSRYWWAVLLGAAYSIIVFMDGKFAPAGVMGITGAVLISWDMMRGAYGVCRTLPLPQRVLMRTIWLEGVVLAPLVYAVWCPVMFLAASAFTDAPIFTGQNAPLSIALTTIAGMGYAAVMMLLLPFLPRPGVVEDQWRLSGILAGGLWGLLCGVAFFLPVMLGKGHAPGAPWSYTVLAAAPVVVALSYFRTTRILLPGRAVQSRRAVAAQPSYPSSNFAMWVGFWVPQVLMVFALFVLSVAMTGAMLALRGGEIAVKSALTVGIFMMVIFAPMTALVWFNSLRALRALPMTSLRLTLFLLTFPTVTVMVITLFMIVLFTAQGEPGMVRPCMMAGLTGFGFGCALCTVFARFGQSVSMLFVMAMMPLFMFYQQKMTPLWLIAGQVAVFFLWHTVKSSSRAYRWKAFNIPR